MYKGLPQGVKYVEKKGGERQRHESTLLSNFQLPPKSFITKRIPMNSEYKEYIRILFSFSFLKND